MSIYKKEREREGERFVEEGERNGCKLESNTRFFIFSIRPILRITPIRSPFCQLTNTRVKQDGIKKMGDRGVEGEHRGGSELTQVRYADAIDG